MSRRVQLVILCEDTMHEAFVHRLLKTLGWRPPRIYKAPPGEGSAENYVRREFPKWLKAHRQNRHRVSNGLVVVIDGDNKGVKARLDELEAACRAKNIEPRQEGDHVAIVVPTWNIETWLAYLNGEDIDESKNDYPRLDHHERDCQPQINALHAMCQERILRQPSPPSLEAACSEYRSRLNRIDE